MSQHAQWLLIAPVVLVAAVFSVWRLLPVGVRLRCEHGLLASTVLRAMLPQRLQLRWAQRLARLETGGTGCGSCSAAPRHRIHPR